MHDRAFLDESTRLQREGVAYCTVTIVDARGSIPQEIGASALFGEAGLLFGTVGGGRLEARCAAQASALLASRTGPRTKFEALNLRRDVAMTCAGEVTLYYEAHHPEDSWNIAIFGAGHVAQKLSRFLLEFDCRVVCADTRAEWLARLPRDERLQALHVRRFADAVEAVRNGTVVVVMTMGHLTDLPILEALAAKAVRIPYLGVIGSKSKAAIMRRQLHRTGLSQCFIDQVVCPAGEKIGGNTPAEIAAGILAQLVRERRRQSESSQPCEPAEATPALQRA
ncbi:MAG: XdhC family protein [Burkholderiaceae bacterium]|nr:XdhC family protein [Burkholderiaceae bacterium]